MGLTTPRYALRYPVAADANNVPSDMLNLATDLDNKMTGYSQGLLSARPAAAISGRVYRATDNGFTYRDTGSAWVIVSRPMAAGGVLDVPGCLAYNDAWPSSPVNGQETDRYADGSNTQIWRFRYDSAGGSFPWYLVGGAPLRIPGATSTYTVPGSARRMSLNDWAPGFAGPFRVTWSLFGCPAAAGNIGLLANQVAASVTSGVFSAYYVLPPSPFTAGAQIWCPWASSGGYLGDMTTQLDSWGWGTTPVFNTYILQNSGSITGPLFLDTWVLPIRGGPWPP